VYKRQEDDIRIHYILGGGKSDIQNISKIWMHRVNVISQLA
jgi:hypothetical protein